MGYEIKLDRYRAIAIKSNRVVNLYSRRHKSSQDPRAPVSGTLHCQIALLNDAYSLALLLRTLTSTRRFSARPDVASFDAAGPASPIAPGAAMCEIGT